MPQMAPLMWLIMLMFFFMMFMINCMIMYFNYTIIMKKNISMINYKKIQYKW
uniref:ATP synthase F0 subunit 8 n=1 Tax=Aenictopecheidae sp. PJ-2015 TaxID=1663421 RepID=A0A3S5FQF9_9HEMI|nr:ATP synthase F0 subunit 8 [Aenictopecheidae sp. PJ-2015]